jgi:hypothetical protein
MNDEKLLELAAKAIGEPYYEHVPGGGLYLSNGAYWNPISIDEDAFRLAVQRNIDICFGSNYVIVRGFTQLPLVNNANDPYAVVRRAIVLAAADMAKAEGWVQS